MLEELSTRSPKSTPKTKLSSFCGNHRNRFRASLRTPNFEPGRTFFSSQRFQVMPFADGLRIAHSFGEFAQSPLCLNGPASMKHTSDEGHWWADLLLRPGAAFSFVGYLRYQPWESEVLLLSDKGQANEVMRLPLE